MCCTNKQPNQVDFYTDNDKILELAIDSLDIKEMNLEFMPQNRNLLKVDTFKNNTFIEFNGLCKIGAQQLPSLKIDLIQTKKKLDSVPYVYDWQPLNYESQTISYEDIPALLKDSISIIDWSSYSGSSRNNGILVYSNPFYLESNKAFLGIEVFRPERYTIFLFFFVKQKEEWKIQKIDCVNFELLETVIDKKEKVIYPNAIVVIGSCW